MFSCVVLLLQDMAGRRAASSRLPPAVWKALKERRLAIKKKVAKMALLA